MYIEKRIDDMAKSMLRNGPVNVSTHGQQRETAFCSQRSTYLGDALGPQPVHRLVHVPLASSQGLLAVHHWSARRRTQRLDHGGGDGLFLEGDISMMLMCDACDVINENQSCITHHPTYIEIPTALSNNLLNLPGHLDLWRTFCFRETGRRQSSSRLC